MKKNIYLKRFLRIIAGLLASVLIITSASFVLNRPVYGADQIVKPFYQEEKDSLDYVVIGSSGTMVGISPLEIYKQTEGVKGYNLSLTAVDANIYKSVLIEIVNNQKDALVIVDVDGFMYEDKNEPERASLCYWMDTMQKNKNWINTIEELDFENRIEHYFPIIRYHDGVLSPGRWKWVTDKTYIGLKGFYNYCDEYSNFTDSEKENVKIMNYNTDEQISLCNKADKKLAEFLECCKELKVENVLFVNMPFAYQNQEKYDRNVKTIKRTNYIENIVLSYGYKVFDYSKTNNSANLVKEDFVDTRHLHISGALKFDKVFAQFLKNNYDFDIHKTTEWDNALNQSQQKYVNIKSLPLSKFE